MNSEIGQEENTVLLLGGSSFLGLQTAQTLFYYYNIICTYNQSIAPKFFPEFNWFQLNFLENKDFIRLNLDRLIEKTTATYLVNFAGISSPLQSKNDTKKSLKINESINSTITEVCEETDTIPIFISSDHVFDGQNGPYSEKDLPNPLKHSIYGQQKYHAEQMYQELENYAIIRISTTLGLNFRFQKQNIYEKTVSNLSKGKKMQGASNKLRTATHCYNVPFLINKIIESFEEKSIEKGIFHVPGFLISEYQLIKRIAETHNFDISLIEETTIDDDNESYPLKLGLESAKTLEILKGKYLSFEDGLSLLNFEYKS